MSSPSCSSLRLRAHTTMAARPEETMVASRNRAIRGPRNLNNNLQSMPVGKMQKKERKYQSNKIATSSLVEREKIERKKVKYEYRGEKNLYIQISSKSKKMCTNILLQYSRSGIGIWTMLAEHVRQNRIIQFFEMFSLVQAILTWNQPQ